MKSSKDSGSAHGPDLNGREFIGLGAGAAGLSLLGLQLSAQGQGQGSSAQEHGARPNVVYFLVDNLGMGDLSSNSGGPFRGVATRAHRRLRLIAQKLDIRSVMVAKGLEGKWQLPRGGTIQRLPFSGRTRVADNRWTG